MPSKIVEASNQNVRNNTAGSYTYMNASQQTEYIINNSRGQSYNLKLETPPQTPITANTSPNTNGKNLNGKLIDSSVIDQNMTRVGSFWKSSSRKDINEEVLLSEIEPMRDLLHDELVKRMNKERAFSKDFKKAVVHHITQKSTPDDIKNFLISKEFSTKYELDKMF